MSQAFTTTTESGVGNGSPTTDRLAAMAHETIDRVTPKANRAEIEMRNTASKTAEGVRHLEEQAKAATERSLRNLQSYIEKNPLTAAGIAFAAGALISVLIRR